MWDWQRRTRVEISLGYGVFLLVRCLGLLIAHKGRIEGVRCNKERFSPLIPIAIEVEMKGVRRKRMAAVVAALNRVSYGCHEVGISPTVGERTEPQSR